MAKKKKIESEPEEDDVPTGKVDEEGDEILDLYDEKDNLDDDLDYDLSQIEDEMLADETEDEEFGYEISEVEALSSSKQNCKVRDDFGCPPDKANK